MTTFIKAKLKKPDDQTNFDKYRVAVNIAEYRVDLLFTRYLNGKGLISESLRAIGQF